MLDRSQMHPYQNDLVDFITDKKSCMIFADMGLGKSVAAATGALDLLNSFEANRVLIVAPKMVADHTWPAEFRQWQHLAHLSITTREQLVSCKVSDDARYNRARKINRQQRATLKEDPHDTVAGKLYKQTLTFVRNHQRDAIEKLTSDVTIVNVDVFEWLVDVMRSRWPWDAIIIDESSSFKAHNTNRFKAYKRAAPYIDNAILLTATPASNGLLNLWSQTFIVDAGERLGANITAYRANYFTSSYDGFGYDLRPGMDKVIHRKIEDISVAMRADDHLDLHDEVFKDVVLTLPPKLRAVYDELEKEFFLSLPEGEIDVETMAVLSSKLRQFCGGSMFASNEDRTVIQIHNLKIKALNDIVEETGGRPLIVGYGFTPERDKIIKSFGGEQRVMTAKTFDQVQWDSGNVPMLTAHPASMGHGVSLQKATNLLAWFSIPWSLEHYLQFMGRINPARQAQSGFNRPSIYYRIYFRDTIEERVIAALHNKAVTQNALLDAIRNKA